MSSEAEQAERCPKCGGLVVFEPYDKEHSCIICGWRPTTTLEELDPGQEHRIRRRGPFRKGINL